MKYVLFILLCLPGVSKHTRASSIVIIVTDSAIYAGADSRQLVDTIAKDNACKIHAGCSFYFTVSGIADPAIERIAQKECCKAKTMPKLIERIQESLRAEYTKVLERYKQSSTDDYKALLDEGNIGAVSFFRFSGGRPELVTLYVRVVNKPDEPIQIKFKAEANNPFIVLGPTEHLKKVPNEEWEPLFNNKPEYIKKIISTEASEHPDWLGGPIDILMVTPKGASWIEKKSICK